MRPPAPSPPASQSVSAIVSRRLSSLLPSCNREARQTASDTDWLANPHCSAFPVFPSSSKALIESAHSRCFSGSKSYRTVRSSDHQNPPSRAQSHTMTGDLFRDRPPPPSGRQHCAAADDCDDDVDSDHRGSKPNRQLGAIRNW